MTLLLGKRLFIFASVWEHPLLGAKLCQGYIFADTLEAAREEYIRETAKMEPGLKMIKCIEMDIPREEFTKRWG